MTLLNTLNPLLFDLVSGLDYVKSTVAFSLNPESSVSDTYYI